LVLGYVTEPVVQLIKILAERVTEKANSPYRYSVVVNYWCIRISTALQKGNARIIQNADDQLKSGRIEVLSDDDQKILYNSSKVAFS
jgi:hypothetical protein